MTITSIMASGISQLTNYRIAIRLSNSWQRIDPKQSTCHAEVQILGYLECLLFTQSKHEDGKPFPYTRCSKKACRLCHELISRYIGKNGQYATSGCDRLVYAMLGHIISHNEL
jgi:hypothetical protein